MNRKSKTAFAYLVLIVSVVLALMIVYVFKLSWFLISMVLFLGPLVSAAIWSFFNLEKFFNKTITVDYSKSSIEMVKEGNYYDVENDLDVVRVPIEGRGIVVFEFKLFRFKNLFYSNSIKRKIEHGGWKVARLEHLLAFGSQYPQEQIKYQIVALGSVDSHGCHLAYVPILDVYSQLHNQSRVLRFCFWDNFWNQDSRFLAIRELLHS